MPAFAFFRNDAPSPVPPSRRSGRTALTAPYASSASAIAVLAAAALLISLIVGTATARSASAATPLTVSQAIALQDGSTQTVRGYVVGEPVATTTVNRTNFTNDYAIAIADAANQSDTTQMVYVQLSTALRATWGLKSNPGAMGRLFDVTGALTAYFAHPGLKNPSAITAVGATPTPTPTPTTTPTGSTGAEAYYTGTEGKTGTALRGALHTIISKQRVLTYDQVWDALKDTDQDPNNSANVIEIYSGRSIAKSDNGGGVDQWNREHVWAKSHGDFGTANGPGTDVHHLRPEDVTVNSDRGNLDFDNGGSAVAQCSGCLRDGDSFEPRAAVKGDVARMIFYMAIRYEGGDGWPNLEPNNSVGNGTSPYIGKLSVLKAWSAADPPDAFEKRRNERIYAQWQGNRNPFVDHPEWVSAIWP